jgi:arylsulfatase A-like enzyme
MNAEMVRKYLLIPFIPFFLLFFCSCTIRGKVEHGRPNILLIVADDLGFTDLGCYGSEIRTPNLDALARSGIRNTSFHTAPTCSPTRAMLLSGVDNHLNGYGTMEGDWAENQVGLKGYEGYLNFDIVPFPVLLQERGYHTSIAGKWHQAYPADDERRWPDKRGFTRSFCLLQGGAGHFGDRQPLFSSYERALYAEDGKMVEQLPEDFYSSDFYAMKVMEYIDESISLGLPFFSFLSFTAPHWPLQVPDEYIKLYRGRYNEGYEELAGERLERGKALGILPETALLPPLTPNVVPWDNLDPDRKRKEARIMEIYAAMIERLDANVGKVVDHLKAAGQLENTLIVFMADNGAEGNSIWGISGTREWVAETFDNSMDNMGRRNSYLFTGPAWAQVSTLPYRWYKAFSTEGGVRCPCIISYPEWDHLAGKINHDFISVMDLAPTFLEFAGVDHPGGAYGGREIFPMDGISLLGWLEGGVEKAHPADEPHCWELYGRRAVMTGEWKAEWYEAPYGSDAWELYNLRIDPSESNNLAEEYPDRLESLVSEWNAYALKYRVTLPDEKVAYGTDEIWRAAGQ